ncbi:AGAP002617-PA [Anopheles gambiae str. PEST]|uniref:AGAP002617-PA n=1 Tax=Anopheles gambiae TaxID=7165 RepID=A7USU0_ANOGA|nr:protein Aster-B [Anopheles gambiae]EDO64225.2 AGAP002617-PA [Anopheles gambiae str. PEST]
MVSSPSERLATDSSDTTDEEPEKTEPPNTAECDSLHSGRQLVHTILPINVDVMFELLFSRSKFLTEFHEVRKTTDMVPGEWKLNKDGLKERVVTLTIAITQTIGPKNAHVTETQVMRKCSLPGQLYAIDVTAVQGGIPYADSFYVTQHYCMSRTVDNHTVFSVHAQVHYRKSIFGFVKGFIEKNTWVGLEDFYTSLLRNLQSEYCIPPAKGKGRRTRRSGHGQSKAMEESLILADHHHTKAKPIRVPAIVVGGGGVGGIGIGGGGGGGAPSKPASSGWRWIVAFMLLVLIVVNTTLYAKLLEMEDMERMSRLDNSEELDSLLLAKSVRTRNDWLTIFQQQESRYNDEMLEWQKVLSTVTEMLNKASVLCTKLCRMPDNGTASSGASGG